MGRDSDRWNFRCMDNTRKRDDFVQYTPWQNMITWWKNITTTTQNTTWVYFSCSIVDDATEKYSGRCLMCYALHFMIFKYFSFILLLHVVSFQYLSTFAWNIKQSFYYWIHIREYTQEINFSMILYESTFSWAKNSVLC